ncbi:MAG: hypothetical protein RLZZ555_408 [Pseudomonadota bacterium]|jgi:hypothetical protein
MRSTKFHIAAVLCAGLLATGCASKPPKDYAEFQRADPRSILVLLPRNSSPDVLASYSVYSQVQAPIAESGYYVLPISLVDEHFKTNGLSVADDIHQVDPAKLREVFGADAALYIDIKDYGARYYVLGSASIVTAEGRLVDLRSGKELWTGKASASSEEQRQNNNMGLAGLLVSALVKQVMASALDESYSIAAITNSRLLYAKNPGALPYGPRHQEYRKTGP